MKQLITATALTLLSAMSGACIAQSLPADSPASAYPVAPAPGLYQAFGEQAGIRSLMDDFVQRLKADARIGQQFRDTNPAQLAGSLTDQVCQLAGGPCTYKGPDMKTAHADMGITRADFNALVEVLQASMNAKGIPFARQNQMLALLAPMHRDVIAPRP
jgi:hemoglobin